jgi:hypothetical protein
MKKAARDNRAGKLLKSPDRKFHDPTNSIACEALDEQNRFASEIYGFASEISRLGLAALSEGGYIAWLR